MTPNTYPEGHWSRRCASAIAQTPAGKTLGTVEVSPFWIAERRRVMDPDEISRSARRLAAMLPAPDRPRRASR